VGKHSISRANCGSYSPPAQPRVIHLHGGFLSVSFAFVSKRVRVFQREHDCTGLGETLNFRLVDCSENGRLTTIIYLPTLFSDQAMRRGQISSSREATLVWLSLNAAST